MLDGISSSWSDVSSGVPQGSLLWPLFFVIFISDLPKEVLPGSTIALYADDCTNVLESLTRLVILNCFNRTWIVCISGVFGISCTSMSRNAKL